MKKQNAFGLFLVGTIVVLVTVVNLHLGVGLSQSGQQEAAVLSSLQQPVSFDQALLPSVDIGNDSFNALASGVLCPSDEVFNIATNQCEPFDVPITFIFYNNGTCTGIMQDDSGEDIGSYSGGTCTMTDDFGSFTGCCPFARNSLIGAPCSIERPSDSGNFVSGTYALSENGLYMYCKTTNSNTSPTIIIDSNETYERLTSNSDVEERVKEKKENSLNTLDIMDSESLSSEEIKNLKEMLESLGYNATGIFTTGRVTSKLDEAVGEFERDYGLPVTREITPATIERINNAIEESLVHDEEISTVDNVFVIPSVVESGIDNVTETTEASVSPVQATSQDDSIEDLFPLGSRNLAVPEVKEALREDNFYRGLISSTASGKAFSRAIERFQEEYQLPVTGKMDVVTLRLLAEVSDRIDPADLAVIGDTGPAPTDDDDDNDDDSTSSNTTCNVTVLAPLGGSVYEIGSQSPQVYFNVLVRLDEPVPGSCSWGVFEGVAGVVELQTQTGTTLASHGLWFHANSPSSIQQYIHYPSYYTAEMSATITQAQAGPMQLVFTEDNAAGVSNPDNFSIPITVQWIP